MAKDELRGGGGDVKKVYIIRTYKHPLSQNSASGGRRQNRLQTALTQYRSVISQISIPRDFSGREREKCLFVRTPAPFIKRHKRFITKPTFPGRNCVVNPKIIRESGSRINDPIKVTRRRSSGTHFPSRRKRPLITARSAKRPPRVAPTCKGERGRCQRFVQKL